MAWQGERRASATSRFCVVWFLNSENAISRCASAALCSASRLPRKTSSPTPPAKKRRRLRPRAASPRRLRPPRPSAKGLGGLPQAAEKRLLLLERRAPRICRQRRRPRRVWGGLRRRLCLPEGASAARDTRSSSSSCFFRFCFKRKGRFAGRRGRRRRRARKRPPQANRFYASCAEEAPRFLSPRGQLRRRTRLRTTLALQGEETLQERTQPPKARAAQERAPLLPRLRR